MRIMFSAFVALAASASHAYDIYSGGVPLPPDHGVWIPVSVTFTGAQPSELRAMPLPNATNPSDPGQTIPVVAGSLYISSAKDKLALWAHFPTFPYYYAVTYHELALAANGALAIEFDEFTGVGAGGRGVARPTTGSHREARHSE